jgi:Mg-chelatase subunit ChlD
MDKFSAKFAVLLLAFAVGTATAAVWFFKQQASVPEPIDVYTPPDAPINQNPNSNEKVLEMVFVVDTTGSMGGLLEGAKQKIWSVINEVMQTKSHPKVRVGLVAYRDNQDAYVTQITPLTEDLDRVYTTLMDFRADGGGDTPENVRRALKEGVEKVSWSKQSQNTAKILFLVGDAPPQNYQTEPDVLDTTIYALRQNIIVNTIQCGTDAETHRIWNLIAQRGSGKFFAIAQDGGVKTVTTPYDGKLAELGNKLGQTYLAYGGGEGEAGETYREEKQMAQAKTESTLANTASNTAQADRALNKAINKDAYSDDLMQSIENGKVKLEDVKEADLPENLKTLSAAERQNEVQRRLAERKRIREEILTLSKQREEFLKNEQAKNGQSNGFDSAVANALREQMSRAGIN